MAVTADQLATAFSLAQVVLLFATAGYVWALRPASSAVGALAWHYPAPVRWRPAPGAVLAGGLGRKRSR